MIPPQIYYLGNCSIRDVNLLDKAGGTNNLLVRPAYSYSIVLIVLIVFVLKALINLYVRSEYWSGHGLTCLVSSPSHARGSTSWKHCTAVYQ